MRDDAELNRKYRGRYESHYLSSPPPPVLLRVRVNPTGSLVVGTPSGAIPCET